MVCAKSRDWRMWTWFSSPSSARRDCIQHLRQAEVGRLGCLARPSRVAEEPAEQPGEALELGAGDGGVLPSPAPPGAAPAHRGGAAEAAVHGPGRTLVRSMRGPEVETWHRRSAES